MLLTALIIKLDDINSPVIYEQIRIGRHGKPFHGYTPSGFVINSTPIAIGDDITGTDNITANSNELQITTAGNAIVMSCGTSTAVNIYTIEGKKAWNGNVYGTVNVTLPKGIYIVNGKKVIL